MPLESISPTTIDALLAALKREFDIVIVDLPSAWTAWTYRVLRQSDQIVLVTQASVPHALMAKRQISLLESQRLGDIPLTLVCNRCGGDNPPSVPIKAIEGAIGRAFDVQVPEERKTMAEAINQGMALAQIRRGSKIERALEVLGERLAPSATATKKRRG
jgi:Flp pilus assembly CpaE family ATPase